MPKTPIEPRQGEQPGENNFIFKTGGRVPVQMLSEFLNEQGSNQELKKVKKGMNVSGI